MKNSSNRAFLASVILLLLLGVPLSCSKEHEPAGKEEPAHKSGQSGGDERRVSVPMGEWGSTVKGVRARIRWAEASRTADDQWDAISCIVELENVSDDLVHITLGPWWNVETEPKWEGLPDLQAIVWDGSSWRRIKGGFELDEDWEDTVDIAPGGMNDLKFTRFAEQPILRRAELLVKAEIGTAPLDLGDDWSGRVGTGPCLLAGLSASEEGSDE